MHRFIATIKALANPNRVCAPMALDQGRSASARSSPYPAWHPPPCRGT